MSIIVGTVSEQKDSNGRSNQIPYKYIRENHQLGFEDGFIDLSAIYLSEAELKNSTYQNERFVVWLDGEIYNKEEFTPPINGSDAEFLCQLYSISNNFGFLSRVDGYFVCVIYDKSEHKIHLFSDRYGLKFLYYTVRQGSFFFSTQLKYLIKRMNIQPKINSRSIECFLSIGYLLENDTMFEDIHIIENGTVYSWGIHSKKLTASRYWWWDDHTKVKNNVGLEEAVEEVGRLFSLAIKKRNYGKVGLNLSGGLDSRAILSELINQGTNFTAITFGDVNSLDVRIAKEICSRFGINHKIFEINEQNWLHGRNLGIWYTDGELDLTHMHGIANIESYPKYFNINMSGLAGDLILGGSYLTKDILKGGGQIKIDKVNSGFGQKAINSNDLISYLSWDKYEQLEHYDFVFLQNRVRRFTTNGLKYTYPFVNVRAPFYDHQLMEFIYSLPDYYRANSNLYNKMLLQQYPLLYKDIPWQTTGKSIDPLISEAQQRKVDEIVKGSIKEFTNYSNWTKTDAMACYLQKYIINDSNNIISQFVPMQNIRNEYDKHFKNEKLYSINLCRYLTLEIWFKQILLDQFE